MDKLDEISIRANHLLITLRKILILVLEYSISLHDACKNKSDLNIGLAEVIAANIQNFGKKKSIQNNTNYKKYFYDGNGKLKNLIDIKKLDISILAILNRTGFISSPPPSKSTNSLFVQSRCCVYCNHDKCFCGVKIDSRTPCKNKANCGYEACGSNCKHQQGCSTGINAASSSECSNPRNCKKMGCPCPSATKCDYVIIKRFTDVAAFFRNCISHGTYVTAPAFDEFPLSKSWREVWEVVNKASLDCLKVLYNSTSVKIDDYKDYEMRLRISLKEDKKHLLEVVSNDIQNFFRVIQGEETISEQMRDYKNEVVDNVKKSMFILLTSFYFFPVIILVLRKDSLYY